MTAKPTQTVLVRLEQELVRRIGSGLLKPGDKLAPVAELAASLGAHPITVQKALHRLKEAGLVQRIPKLGTFVRRGRDVFRAAVVLGPSLTDENTYFYRALLNALRADATIPRWQCFAYDWVNSAKSVAELDDLPAYRHFLTDHEHQPFAGLIGVGLAPELWARFQERAPVIPSVLMGLNGDVRQDLWHFGHTGATWLAGEGCRSIVYLRTLPPPRAPDIEGVREALADQPGVTLRIIQMAKRGEHYSEQRDADFCRRLVATWEREGAWPDGILISDDVTMRGLAHALVGCGADRVEQTRVLSWGNKGVRLHYGVPVARYEVDTADYARALAARLIRPGDRGAGEDGRCLIRGRLVEALKASLATVG